MISYIKYIFFLLLLYLFIYNPPFKFLPSSFVELLILPTLLYLVISLRWFQFLKVFKIELSIFILILLFCFFRELGSSGSVFFKANVLLLLESLFIPYFLILLYYKIKDRGNLFKEVVYVGIVASFITFAMIAFPGLNAIIKNQILKSTDLDDLLDFRSFGLSEGLTFAYGIVQGLIFALVFYYSRKSPKYLFFLPFLLISIFFNARIGLIPVILVFVYFVILKFDFKFISLSFLLGFIFYLVIFKTAVFSDYAKTIEWAFDFFSQSSDFLAGNADKGEVNTFSTLFGDMAVFPQNTEEWLLGTGENIFLLEQGNSDVGYLIQVNYGGLLYMFLVLLLLGRIIWRMKFLFVKHRWFLFLISLTIILGNVKGLFFSVIPNFRLIMLLYCYLILEYRKDPKAIDYIFNVPKLNGKNE